MFKTKPSGQVGTARRSATVLRSPECVFNLDPHVVPVAEKMLSNRLYRFCWILHVGSRVSLDRTNSLTLAFRLKMDAEENSVVRLDRCAEQQAFRHRSAGTHRVGLFATEVGAVPAHAKVLTRSARS